MAAGGRLLDLRAYLYRMVTWAQGDGADLVHLPRLFNHRRRVEEQPSVERVLAEGAA